MNNANDPGNLQQAAQPPAPAPKPTDGGPQAPDYLLDTYIDAEGYRAAAAATLHPLIRVGYPILSGVIFLAGVFFVVLEGLSYLPVIYFLLSLILIFVRLSFPQRMARRQLARMQEVFGMEQITERLVFWPQGVAVQNQRSGGQVNLRYEFVRLIARRDGWLILCTRQKQAVILPLEAVADKPDFVPYLLSKCPGAKRKGL